MRNHKQIRRFLQRFCWVNHVMDGNKYIAYCCAWNVCVPYQTEEADCKEHADFAVRSGIVFG